MTDPLKQEASPPDELLQELALKLDLANMELRTIDNVLARRPALADYKHRTEKIERCCEVAAYADRILCEIAQTARMHKNTEIQILAESAVDKLRGRKP